MEVHPTICAQAWRIEIFPSIQKWNLKGGFAPDFEKEKLETGNLTKANKLKLQSAKCA